MTIRLRAILPFLVLALAPTGCAKRDPDANRRRSEALVLRRQIDGLRDLVAAAERGELSGAKHILIGVEEKLLTELLNANLPPEMVVAERFRVQLKDAEVRFRASQGIVLLRARITLVKHPDRFGDVLLAGGLEEVQVEPATGRLTARVSLFHFEMEKSSGGVLTPIVQALLNEFGYEGLSALSAAIPPIEIPVRLEPQIRIAGFGDGPVSAAPGQLPIRISIARVAPLSGRLWIMLDAAAGPWEALPESPPPPETTKAASASSAGAGRPAVKRYLLGAIFLLGVLVAGGLLFLRWRFPPPPPPPTAAELAQLLAEREALQERFRELTTKKDDEGFAEAPKGGVLIGIPTSFTESVVEQLVTGLLGEVRLTLKNLKVHKADDVRAKLVFTKRTLGSFVLDLDLHEIQARLKPAAPALTFGGNRIGITLPVTAAESHATATIRFQWDSRGMANLACGNLDVTRDVDGSAVPTTYVVKGYFDLATDKGALLADPEFGELRIRVKVAPSEAAWKVVDDLIAEQEGMCGSALRKIDVKEKIAKILDRGFNVKLPAKLFRPIRLPAGIQQSMELQGVQLLLEVKPTGLSVAKKRIWYGADIATHRGPTPGPTPTPTPAPAEEKEKP